MGEIFHQQPGGGVALAAKYGRFMFVQPMGAVGIDAHFAAKGIVEAAELIEILVSCFTLQDHAGWATARRIAAELQPPGGGLQPLALPQSLGLQTGDRSSKNFTNPAGLGKANF